MADEDVDWFSVNEDEPPAPRPALKGSKAAKEADAAAASAAVAAEEAAATAGEAGDEAPTADEGEPEPEGEYLDPDKLILFRHWKRPKFLQYRYLYNYRHNYYNDVIDYLDKKQRGIKRDVPVAQTWAERTLRYHSNNEIQRDLWRQDKEDKKLVEETKIQGLFQLHHSKNYITRRFYSVVYL